MLTKFEPDDVADNSFDLANITASIEFGFLLTRLRKPSKFELKTLTDGYAEYLKHYQNQPSDALQLISNGESKRDESLAPDQLAAMTSIATILLNLDETITKQ